MSRERRSGEQRPAGDAPGALPPVPTGLDQLLRLAAVDLAFREVLLEKRGEAAEAAGVKLTGSERAVLAAIPAAQLEAMAASLPPPAAPRRLFLQQAAASAVVALGGAALAACDRPREAEPQSNAGATAELPPAPQVPDTAPFDAAPRPDAAPPPDATPAVDAAPAADAQPERPPEAPVSRPERPHASRGIRSDLPSNLDLRGAEGGPTRPSQNRGPMGGGSAPDMPPGL